MERPGQSQQGFNHSSDLFGNQLHSRQYMNPKFSWTIESSHLTTPSVKLRNRINLDHICLPLMMDHPISAEHSWIRIWIKCTVAECKKLNVQDYKLLWALELVLFPQLQILNTGIYMIFNKEKMFTHNLSRPLKMLMNYLNPTYTFLLLLFNKIHPTPFLSIAASKQTDYGGNWKYKPNKHNPG